MMSHIRFTAVALALVAAPLAAQQGRTVRLHFNWQPGMRAEVDYEQLRVRNVSGRVDSLRVASTYRMDVSTHAAVIAIAYSGTRWTELHSTDPVLGRYYEALARTTRGGRARTLVSRGGGFLRVDGTEAVAGELDQALEPLLEYLNESELRNVRRAASALVSPQALSAAAADEWNTLVGVWAGRELKMGEPQKVESSFQAPLLPGATIPIHLQFSAAGRVRCTPDDAEERCVKLEMLSVPDREVMEQAIRDHLERAGAPFQEAQALLSQFNVQNFITLHTEPQTLRPHYMQYRRVVNANPGENAVSQVDTRTFRFRYLP